MNYGTPKKLVDGRYFLKITDGNSGRVILQMNKVTFLTKFDDLDDVTIKLSEESVSKIVGIDQENLAAAKINCTEWFGKQMIEQTLDTAYTKSIQDTSMNVGKLPNVKVYNHDKTIMDSSELVGGETCDIMLELSGIWFMKKTFGSVWRIVQVRLTKPPKKVYTDEYLFQDTEVDENDQEDDYI